MVDKFDKDIVLDRVTIDEYYDKIKDRYRESLKLYGANPEILQVGNLSYGELSPCLIPDRKQIDWQKIKVVSYEIESLKE